LDVGAEMTRAVPVYDGYVLKKSFFFFFFSIVFVIAFILLNTIHFARYNGSTIRWKSLDKGSLTLFGKRKVNRNDSTLPN